MESGLSSPGLAAKREHPQIRLLFSTLWGAATSAEMSSVFAEQLTGAGPRSENKGMEQTFAYSSWFFTRALSLVYVIAFLTLVPQARGLWGKQGILPIAPLMKSLAAHHGAKELWQVPSVFWLSSSDDFIFGAAITGAVFAVAAFLGFAQGWCLLMCFVLYLSFCSSGQDFMAFQWDALLLELGFLALFVVPWNFDFSLGRAVEPHWFVRAMFYLVLFKLMFLSGVLKLMSGDESWRDLTALRYHYWTQPLPNPVSPFMHSLPEWFHQISTALTFAVELLLPFFIFWPRARVWAATGFIVLSLSILLTGNYAFFNWLTLALCLWLIPDSYWHSLMERMPFTLETIPAAMFPHPVISGVMGALALYTVVWCTRFWLPEAVLGMFNTPLQISQIFHISNSYGLFANMTKSRPEIVIEGSHDGQEWKEYEFKYKPGPLYRMPPLVAPYQPRLDWQMWFAALGPAQNSPWVQTLLARLGENSSDVLDFFSSNPFAAGPPEFVRARLYTYEFSTPEDIVESEQWWKRTLVGEFLPVTRRP